MATKYLKKGNTPTIIIALIWSIALFIVFFNGTSDFWVTVKDRVSALKARDSLFCFLTPLVLSVAVGLLPASWKAVLVFWKIRNPLPGSRVFSNLSLDDPRIDQSRIQAKMEVVPQTPGEENALWYRWYKTVQDRVTVLESHRQYLLNRDLAGIFFLFLIFGTLTLTLSDVPLTRVLFYGIVMLIHYIVFAVVARNHGNRFACNVLVEYQSKK